MTPFGIHTTFRGSFDEAIAKVGEELKVETIGARGGAELASLAREVRDRLVRVIARVGGQA